uniref:(California timema) hypothetical protein n=1 Tax=Timema californicum TaxID=61474 RepID=A0A7R9IVN4_TIMCA|nr:unnamed protein product [Timema californicum]
MILKDYNKSTIKYMQYLNQLFDKDNYVNKHFGKFLFTTEGHILPIDSRFRSKLWEIKEGSLDIKSTKQNTTLLTDYLTGRENIVIVKKMKRQILMNIDVS